MCVVLRAWLMYIKLDTLASPKSDRLLYLDKQAIRQCLCSRDTYTFCPSFLSPLSEWRNCVPCCRMTIGSTVVTVARGAGVSDSPGRTASWVRQYHERPATERLYSAVLQPPPSPSARWIWGVTGRFLAVKGGGGEPISKVMCCVCVIPIRSLYIVFWAFQKKRRRNVLN
jgi:hypothetical protein